jgi:hypothetical protein
MFAFVSPNVKRENTENRGEQAVRIQPEIPAINLKIGKLTPEEVGVRFAVSGVEGRRLVTICPVR